MATPHLDQAAQYARSIRSAQATATRLLQRPIMHKASGDPAAARARAEFAALQATIASLEQMRASRLRRAVLDGELGDDAELRKLGVYANDLEKFGRIEAATVIARLHRRGLTPPDVMAKTAGKRR
jgi:hypothetical protein